MQWEIGLVNSPFGTATEIAGPFDNMDDAAKATADRNEKENRKGFPRWMWARKGEMNK